MFTPDFTTFENLSNQGNLIPIYREILGDLETPVAILRKLGGSPYHTRTRNRTRNSPPR